MHILDGNAPDLVAECSQFEKEITKVGGVELLIGGTYSRNFSSDL